MDRDLDGGDWAWARLRSPSTDNRIVGSLLSMSVNLLPLPEFRCIDGGPRPGDDPALLPVLALGGDVCCWSAQCPVHTIVLTPPDCPSTTDGTLLITAAGLVLLDGATESGSLVGWCGVLTVELDDEGDSEARRWLKMTSGRTGWTTPFDHGLMDGDLGASDVDDVGLFMRTDSVLTTTVATTDVVGGFSLVASSSSSWSVSLILNRWGSSSSSSWLSSDSASLFINSCLTLTTGGVNPVPESSLPHNRSCRSSESGVDLLKY